MSRLLIWPDDPILLEKLIFLRFGVPENFDYNLGLISDRLTVIINDDSMTWKDIASVNVVMLRVLPPVDKIRFAWYVVSKTVWEYSKELYSKIR